MDTKRWQAVERVFHAALDLSDSQRHQFVRNQCGEDSELIAEVLSLIQSSTSETGILDDAAAPLDGQSLQKAVDVLRNVWKRRDHAQEPDGGATSISERQLSNLIADLNANLEFRRCIAVGGMGTVVEAFDRSLCRSVAVKLFPKFAGDQGRREEILRESRAIAGVQSDYIVKIYRVGEHASTPWLEMEFINGPSLKERLAASGALVPADAAKIMSQVALGLAAAHQHSLIHRDVKPGNILVHAVEPFESDSLLGPDIGRARLIDFGLAQHKLPESDSSESEIGLAGTPAYMSPEQLLRPRVVDHRTDIYSAGVTLYELLTGQRPHRGTMRMLARAANRGEPVRPRDLDDRIPLDLESICLKAMDNDPLRRYQTAMEFAQDLQRFLNGEPTVARPVTRFQRLQKWMRRNPGLAASLALTLLAFLSIGLGGLWFGATIAAKNREILKQRHKTLEARIDAVLDAEAGAVPILADNLNVDRQRAIAGLRKLLQPASLKPSERFNGLVALAMLGEANSDALLELTPTLYVSPGICRNLVAALSCDPRAAETVYQRFLASRDTNERIRLAIVNAHLGDWRPWNAFFDDEAEPDETTTLIHTLAQWHANLTQLAAHFNPKSPAACLPKWSVAQAIGLIPIESLHASEMDAWLKQLRAASLQTRDPGLRSSSRWALARWGQSAGDSAKAFAASDSVFCGFNGVELVRIEAGTALLGRLDIADLAEGWDAHRVTFSRPYWIASSETTIDQFRAFLGDALWPSHQKPQGFQDWQPDAAISPTGSHPAQMVSWIDAVLYCNWLSDREGLTPCYTCLPSSNRDDVEPRYDRWIIDYEANGYRLPSDSEWEYACRAGSVSRWSFGNDPQWFLEYGTSSSHRAIVTATILERLPNRWGLFQMHGNVWEWCNDWYSTVGAAPLTDPRGPEVGDADNPRRVYRGGGVATMSGDSNSGSRGAGPPVARYNNLGFRVARSRVE